MSHNHYTRSSDQALSTSSDDQDPLGLLRRIHSAWPENEFYFNQLWHYITGNPNSGETSISSYRLSDTPSTSQNGFESYVDDSESTATLIPVENVANSLEVEQNIALVVVEGFPSPSTIRRLAIQYGIPRELLIGHLGLEKVQNSVRSCYELPALISRRENLVHVRLVSLWRTSPHIRKSRVNAKKRKTVQDAIRRHEKELFEGKYGSTRVRRVHLHDSQHFTIEQVVSFCFLQIGNRSQYTCM